MAQLRWTSEYDYRRKRWLRPRRLRTSATTDGRVVHRENRSIRLRAVRPYLELLRRALEVRKRVIGGDVVAAIMTSNLGLIREARGDLDGAEGFYREGEAIYATLNEREFFEHGFNLNNLAMLLLLKGNPAEAEVHIRHSLRIMKGILGPEHVNMGLGQMNLARIELALGRAQDALVTVTQAATLLEHLPRNHVHVAKTELYKAEILLALKRASEAETLARRALSVRANVYPAGDWRIAEAQGILGRIRLDRGDTTEGRSLLASSLASFTQTFGATHPRSVEAQNALDQRS